ncbi:MAG: serine/threonine-protein kinase PknD [Chlamydiia bacterium]|nr:serine/threonine-protein kinase PknD [Chlamydiia bacterium]
MKKEIFKSQTIGRYELLSLVAKGGMGEVWLAYDPICDRKCALKRIRQDIKSKAAFEERFLKEAKITASLTHPGIITIYTIAREGESLYYTMPFVEGKNFKEMLKEGKESIPSLLPIFCSICQTVAYAHSNGIIHRDLKPENILVGKFGEVIILDWGLAIHQTHEEEELPLLPENASSGLTEPGKVMGTLAFLAPERICGKASNPQTDIYALGVMLYQILTLRFPFRRISIKEFKKKWKKEVVPDPEEVAPYRDVPPHLSMIVKKCLAKDPRERYAKADELVYDLLAHIEGRGEWYGIAILNLNNKQDWEFQENVLIAKHIAIARSLEGAEWVSMMLSKGSFAKTLKIECEVTIHEFGAGIGLMLGIPESAERDEPIEGYCLWLGSEPGGSYLFKKTAAVMCLPAISLKKGIKYEITLEKRDHNIHCSIDGIHQFSYISHLPLLGTHVGILSRDADFSLSPMRIFVGSDTLEVNCLAIPDAFLASKDYARALAEYRRIGYSFPGHAEGREALFRAGVTLLEQGKMASTHEDKGVYFSLALEEFSRLQGTPGAPLEYLGKSLVYAALGDQVDEIKCLELGLRRYFQHPLIAPIKEQVIYRLHQSAIKDRPSAYRLTLTVLNHLADVANTSEFHRLFDHLVQHWEKLPFFEEGEEKNTAIILSFWLAELPLLLELYGSLDPTNPKHAPLIGNILTALFELGAKKQTLTLLKQLENEKHSEDLQERLIWFRPLVVSQEKNLIEGIKTFFALNPLDIGIKEFRTIRFLLEIALFSDSEELIASFIKNLSRFSLSDEQAISCDTYLIWSFLIEEKWKEAGEIFSKYSLESLNHETNSLHSLFGCWLAAVEGNDIAMIHFAGVTETPFPRSWALLSFELTNQLVGPPSWEDQSFLFERRQLDRYLAIYYHCTENPEKETLYREKENLEYVRD